MAAPIPVQCPVIPRTPETNLFIPSQDGLVTATPFLPWAPAPPAVAGGANRVTLATHQAVRAFCLRCRISRVQADLVAARAVSIITLSFTAGAWSRILTAVKAAVLAAPSPPQSFHQLQRILKSAIFSPANALDITQPDWAAGPALTIPAGNAAAAIHAREMLVPLRFLDLARLPLLENSADAAEPWLVICELSGALGPVLTQGARSDEVSSIQSVASQLRAMGAAGVSDGPLASGLRATLINHRLPLELRSGSLDHEVLCEELIDGLHYRASRERIEEKRIHTLGAQYARPPCQ